MANKTVDILLKLRADLSQMVKAREESQKFQTQLTSMNRLLAQGAGFGAGFLGISSLSGAMQDAITTGIAFNANLEQQTVAFKTLLGDQELATQRIQQLTEFSATTPFQLEEVIEANRLLQTLTEGALATEDGMRLVGDAAAAVGRDFAETSLHIGRLYSGLESGLPIGEATMRLTEMGLISGDTRIELQRLAEEGALGAAQAMEVLGDAFGDTAGAMQLQSQTFNGVLSTVKDNLTIILGELMKPQFEGLSILLTKVGEMMGALDTEEQTRAAAIDKQTQALLDQVQAMASLEDAESARTALIEAQERARSRIENREKRIELLKQIPQNAPQRRQVNIEIDIAQAEIDAYKDKLSQITVELARFGKIETEKTIADVSKELLLARIHLEELTKIDIPAATQGETKFGAFGEEVTETLPVPQELATKKVDLENRIEMLSVQKASLELQQQIQNSTEKTVEQIIEANKKEKESLALEQARKQALRQAQEFLSKNKEKIAERIEKEELLKQPLETQLGLLQEQKKEIQKSFTDRIKNTDVITVKQAQELEMKDKLLDLDKQIETVEKKITAEKTKQNNLDDQNAKIKAKQFFEDQEATLIESRRNITRQRAILDADFSQTDFEKRDQTIDLINQEIQAHQTLIDNLEKEKLASDNIIEKKILSQKIDQQTQQIDRLESQSFELTLGPDPESFADNFVNGITRMRESWGTFQQQVSTSLVGTINTGIRSTTDELHRAIMFTNDWKGALQGIGQAILSQIVRSIIQMGVQYVATKILVDYNLGGPYWLSVPASTWAGTHLSLQHLANVSSSSPSTNWACNWNIKRDCTRHRRIPIWRLHWTRQRR